MELIDSHAHLDLKEFNQDLENVLLRAAEAGLTHVVTIGINVESSMRAIELARKYDFVSATIGFHPHDAKSLTSDQSGTIARPGHSASCGWIR